MNLSPHTYIYPHTGNVFVLISSVGVQRHNSFIPTLGSGGPQRGPFELMCLSVCLSVSMSVHPLPFLAIICAARNCAQRMGPLYLQRGGVFLYTKSKELCVTRQENSYVYVCISICLSIYLSLCMVARVDFLKSKHGDRNCAQLMGPLYLQREGRHFYIQKSRHFALRDQKKIICLSVFPYFCMYVCTSAYISALMSIYISLCLFVRSQGCPHGFFAIKAHSS